MAKTQASPDKSGVTPSMGDVITSIEHEAYKRATSNKKEPAGNGGFFVYIGPSIIGVIQSGAIFRDDSPEDKHALTAAIARIPEIKPLLIPGTQLAQARVKLKTPGNALNVSYNKLVSTLKSQ